MPERLKQLLDKIKEWWNKFTSRQKGIIIGLTVFTILIFGIIVFFVSRPKYKVLITASSTAEASQIIGILDENSITHTESQDALTISVDTSQYTAAELALGSSGYVPEEYTLEDALSNSLSTTASDTAKRYQLYLENKLKANILSIDGVKDCKVNLNIPEDTGTLISNEEEASAYIQIEHDGSFTAAKAANLAKSIQTFLRNSNTANITILDSDGTLLFAGGDDYSSSGIANSMQELRNQAESMIANQVKKVLLGTPNYNNIEVTSHLDMDYSNYERTVKEYYANEGRTEGMLSHEENYESTAENGVGGIPGTDSNGEGTTYVTSDYGNSSTSTTETEKDYLPNESSEYRITPAGAINYSNSSMSITAISYREIRQEDAEIQGLLDGTTWEEYKIANSADRKLEVDPDLYMIAANATGIPVGNITIVAYESPIFYDKEGMQVSWTTVLSAFLIILILGLLAFVILRSMNGRKEEETPPELSVEDLLQSSPEPQLEDIDVDGKSDTRKMIEKFVDENPEAAAALLRNWLTDEWS
ncbi:MAG: flagellar M-ring protein FliF [Lachnospiraceae bacterium]|nr:flagellar M-ring protein FliF [Lachnospiraceae bacterium]